LRYCSKDAGYIQRNEQMPDQHNEQPVTFELLDAFADAWNRHDVDAIMSAMTDDCVFEASAGVGVKGTVYDGQRQVRKGVESVFEQFADAQWSEPRHFIAGNRAVTEWVFTGTREDGVRVEVQGCDVFTFEGGKIAVKNSYRKQRSGY
jgi:ketosteroid isomerase-like protein